MTLWPTDVHTLNFLSDGAHMYVTKYSRCTGVWGHPLVFLIMTNTWKHLPTCSFDGHAKVGEAWGESSLVDRVKSNPTM